jgi:hypothetical protein
MSETLPQISRRAVLSVDPGASHCAYAFFDVCANLLACGLEEGKPRELAHYLHRRFAWGRVEGWEPILVIERMQVYKGPKKTDDNDLILVSETAGHIKCLFPLSHSVKPALWKGQVPKEVTQRRMEEAIGLAVLNEQMAGVPKGKRNHIFDAIGIGEWYLRTKPKFER